eukprot:4905018-Pyramimonas_sp.AAC.1
MKMGYVCSVCLAVRVLRWVIRICDSEDRGPSRVRMPCTAASLYCSGFSDSSLCVMSVPSGLRATMSVK